MIYAPHSQGEFPRDRPECDTAILKQETAALVQEVALSVCGEAGIKLRADVEIPRHWAPLHLQETQSLFTAPPPGDAEFVYSATYRRCRVCLQLHLQEMQSLFTAVPPGDAVCLQLHQHHTRVTCSPRCS